MDTAGLILAIAIVILTIQARVSWRLMRSPMYERRQRWLQLGLIWAVPILGAVIVHMVMRVEAQPASRLRQLEPWSTQRVQVSDREAVLATSRDGLAHRIAPRSGFSGPDVEAAVVPAKVQDDRVRPARSPLRGGGGQRLTPLA